MYQYMYQCLTHMCDDIRLFIFLMIQKWRSSQQLGVVVEIPLSQAPAPPSSSSTLRGVAAESYPLPRPLHHLHNPHLAPNLARLENSLQMSCHRIQRMKNSRNCPLQNLQKAVLITYSWLAQAALRVSRV